MSHTIRRKRSHTPHDRGERTWRRARNCPPPVQAKARARRDEAMARMVSDHAIVRWMMRVVGIDLRQKFIANLLTHERAELIAAMQSGRVRVNDTNVVLIVRGGVVASVVVDGAPD